MKNHLWIIEITKKSQKSSKASDQCQERGQKPMIPPQLMSWECTTRMMSTTILEKTATTYSIARHRTGENRVQSRNDQPCEVKRTIEGEGENRHEVFCGVLQVYLGRDKILTCWSQIELKWVRSEEFNPKGSSRTTEDKKVKRLKESSPRFCLLLTKATYVNVAWVIEIELIQR